MFLCVCVCVRVCVRACMCVEPYSHCSSPPSCINGDLATAGEANAKQCISHLMVEVQVQIQVGLWVPTPLSAALLQGTSAIPQKDLSCTDLQCLLDAQVSQLAWIGATV